MVGFVEVSETSGSKYGMGSGIPLADTRPVVSNLAVDPRVRRCGVGSALMEACEDLVKTWNFDEIILQVCVVCAGIDRANWLINEERSMCFCVVRINIDRTNQLANENASSLGTANDRNASQGQHLGARVVCVRARLGIGNKNKYQVAECTSIFSMKRSRPGRRRFSETGVVVLSSLCFPSACCATSLRPRALSCLPLSCCAWLADEG